jgi:hypothetical protein
MGQKPHTKERDEVMQRSPFFCHHGLMGFQKGAFMLKNHLYREC